MTPEVEQVAIAMFDLGRSGQTRWKNLSLDSQDRWKSLALRAMEAYRVVLSESVPEATVDDYLDKDSTADDVRLAEMLSDEFNRCREQILGKDAS